nr:helix-turn-helix domain-containing protein [Rhodococcus sp. NBC_00297]
MYNGAELVSTLEVYLDSGTLQSKAGLVNLHHSSVAHRLTTLSRHLGFAVDLPENRARTEAWMMVHRMRTREEYPHTRRPI